MSSGKDPWDWTIDDVVNRLCNSLSIYQEAGWPNPSLPDPTSFELQLREHVIDGATLLTGVNQQFLKEDLQIKALGRRQPILAVVKYLQGQSPKYCKRHDSAARPSFSAGFSTPNSFFPQTATPVHLPLPNFTRSLPDVPHFNQNSETDGPPLLSNHEAGAEDRNPPRQSLSGSHAQHDNSHISQILGAATHARQGEDVVTDQNGRKRRKLNLSTTNLATSKVLPDPTDKQPTTPTNLSSSKQTQRQQVSTKVVALKQQEKHPSPADYRIGFFHKRFPVDAIFYGQAEFGSAISDGDENEDDSEYSFAEEVPFGVSTYVYRQMAHFLRIPHQEEVLLRGKPATAIYPYRRSILPSAEQAQSVTVFQQVNGGVRVTREDVSQLNADTPYEPNLNHGWDYLSHWANEDSKVLPPLGESDTEMDDSSSIIDSEDRESEKDIEEEKPTRAPLPVEDKIAIVDQAVEDFKEYWQRRKLPMKEHNAWVVWNMGRKSRMRRLLIEGAKAEIEALDVRLERYKKDIVANIYYKEADIRQQCAILEQTVFVREEEILKISIWQKNQEPKRTVPKPRTQKKAASKLALDEEGISVGSDSEAASDGLSQFVDIDEIDMTQVMPNSSPDEGSSNLRRSTKHLSSELGQHLESARAQSPEDSVLGPAGLEDAMGIDEEPVDINKDEAAANAVLNTIENGDEGHLPTPGNTTIMTAGSQIPLRQRTPASVIDLTYSSDSSSPEDTPVKIHQEWHIPSSHRFNGEPENSSPAEIAGWTWIELSERTDRKRTIIKILSEIASADRDDMKKRIQQIREKYFLDEMKRGIGALLNGESKLPGTEPVTFAKIIKFARLYLCWVKCTRRWWTIDAAEARAKEMNVKQLLRNAEDQNEFYNFVKTILLQAKLHQKTIAGTASSSTPRKGKSPVRNATALPSSQDFPRVSSTEGGGTTDSPHKKRKRAVQKSQSAMQKRESAQQRRQEQEVKEQLLSQEIGQDITEGGQKIILNTSKLEKHGFVYLNESIASKIKKHQIDGLRFMWREIVTAGQSESQGCLLAHTMGLGKTMQAITLLVAIAEASNSKDRAIYEQIPMGLRKSRTLVMCPPSLIWNWMEEFAMWIPSSARTMIGQIRCINSETPLKQRLLEIHAWFNEGGVLVLGYEMLRSYVLNKATKVRDQPLTDEEHKSVLKHLLQGPNIIIADEAHTLKNLGSAISMVAEKFRSTSRIALTGSPLANNLLEYFAMINWVSPGYLGDLVEFKAHYQEPIQLGLYSDSTQSEYRMALKKLRILKNEIEPKVNRADITVLKGNLKPKVEFVITVPLTELQKEAYKIYVEYVLESSKDGEVENARIWSWLALLGLLCNHPLIYFDKLFGEDPDPKKRPKSATKTKTSKLEQQDAGNALSNAEDEESLDSPGQYPDDVPVSKLGFSESMLEVQKEIFEKAKESLAIIHLSYKIEVFEKILDYCEEYGDRVLVFSHSIPTLNFLENSFKEKGRSYQRIDGSTKASSRQNAAKEFNYGVKASNIFLISTRAGGLGLNLPGANRVIIFDFGFNPTWEEQAVGRAYRIGQEKPVFVYRFVAGGTFETIVYNKAVFKTQLAYRVVDKKNVQRHAQRSRDFLFNPKPVPQEDIRTFRGKDVHVLDRILDLDNSLNIRAITTTETLQEEIAEDFTAEEMREIEKMQEIEKLRKVDPLAWKQRIMAEQTYEQQTLLGQSMMAQRRREAMAMPWLAPAPSTASVEHFSDLDQRAKAVIQTPTRTGPHLPPKVSENHRSEIEASSDSISSISDKPLQSSRMPSIPPTAASQPPPSLLAREAPQTTKNGPARFRSSPSSPMYDSLRNRQQHSTLDAISENVDNSTSRQQC
ncbi:hypothetical protein K432DRAFT_288219 [Lepidopterella palustris CBS 459.81]|uniref:Uncharacterized protein n=1 Tax=Lepidopterella palustris CBS 459.81 TaxID=1314670 RepID=A0A8E2EIY8_9PEZI|nr:hypothetical protein K432DRAFT_288219 [Lepidopterella palustris CBS 459.81]